MLTFNIQLTVQVDGEAIQQVVAVILPAEYPARTVRVLTAEDTTPGWEDLVPDFD